MDPRHPQRVAASFASSRATLPFVAVPSLVTAAPGDETVHADPAVGRRAFAWPAGEKRRYEVDGGHVGLLSHPSAPSDEASAGRAGVPASHLLG